MVVGGLASIPGAIFGAIFIQFVPNLSDALSKSAPAAIYGVIMIGLMYLMPGGVVYMLRSAFARWRGFAGSSGQPAPAPAVTVLPVNKEA